MKSASGFACRIISASTIQSANARLRSSFSASKPMLVQTSVVTRSAPRHASIGSANDSEVVAVGAADALAFDFVARAASRRAR